MLNWVLKLKKWISVFFMLAIFIPLLSSVTLLVWHQIIRCQMMEEFEAKNLTTITIKKNNLQWTREGKEIEVNGKLFDVENISIQGGDYVITGLYDVQEDALLQTLKKSQQAADNNPLQLLASQVLYNVLFIENKMDWQQVTFQLQSPNYSLFNTSNFISFSPSLAGPPPKYS